MRRIYEQQGHRFYTENDSEIIGLYIADQMAQGASFEDALQTSLTDFDGAFSYLAATADSLGYVKDPFAFKPLIVTETPAYVAIATEEQALRSALGDDFPVWEPGVNAVMTWTVAEA
jgi:glutamine phosphoribosylpyrophosphate amidotransferase